MKNKIYLIAILIIMHIKVQGQDKIRPGIIKTQSITFLSKKIGDKFIEVNNQNNLSIINTSPRTLKRLSEVKYSNIDALWSAFLAVFGKQKLQQLLPEKNMVITFYPNHTGRIRAVQFLVKNNTIINSSELELLEKKLKSDISFIIPKGENDSDDIWPLTQVVFFQKLYQRSMTN